MRTALISPYSLGPMRGNIVTVQRIAHFLNEAGVEAMVLAADALSGDQMERRLRDFSPDLIHAFHACYCGAIAWHHAGLRHVPFIITITGSDIHDPLLRGHPDTVQAIKAAHAVVCFNCYDAEIVAGCFPDLAGGVTLIPQGVEPLPAVEGESFGLSPDDFVVLLPAALRPVKRIEFALEALAPLSRAVASLRLVIVGGVIDHDYAAAIRTMLCDFTFAVWLGEIPHELMGGLYRRADVVLNCSRSESMPNSLMEAMALGRSVLAADITGNRSLVHDGVTGGLFTDEADFRRQLLQIMEDPAVRVERGDRARQYIQSSFSPQLEADRYKILYQKVCTV